MNIAIITGASSGMGRELVLQLADQENFDEIWVIARRTELLETLKEEVSIPIRPIAMDLTAPDSLERYRDLLEFSRPNVEFLANVSGYGRFGTYERIPVEDSLNIIDLNVRALVGITELTLPYMKRGARIMEWDSLSAFQPVPYLNVYSASKAFVLSYTRALGEELKERGIRVLAVCPYWTDTEFFARANETDDTAVTNFEVMYQPADVVSRALFELDHTRKDVSIYGGTAKFTRIAAGLLPKKLVMFLWKKRQHH